MGFPHACLIAVGADAADSDRDDCGADDPSCGSKTHFGGGVSASEVVHANLLPLSTHWTRKRPANRQVAGTNDGCARCAWPKSITSASGISAMTAVNFRAHKKSIALSKAQARGIWLRAQKLDTSEPFGDGSAATLA